jgi:hypothetical protein
VVQARRYLRHPLYLVGLALLAATSWELFTTDQPGFQAASDHFYPAFFLGVFGVIVANRLTRTEDAALALLPSAPMPATTRTLALFGACLVPALTAAVWLLLLVLKFVRVPPPAVATTAYGAWGLTGTLLAGSVVACFGGPALGVAVGRWLRFPGAGMLTAVVLVVVVMLGTSAALALSPSAPAWNWLGTLMPYSSWEVVDTTDAGVDTWRGLRDGAPFAYLFYTLGLCGLAVWAGVMKDAEGRMRRRWSRFGALLAVATAAAYLLAVLG